MQTSAVGSTTATTAGSSSVLTGASTMGKEEFLKLLVTQLRSQNPLDPLGNEEFVAQLAQFGSLEQMQNVASATETNTRVMGSVNNAVATSFIGREAVVSSSEFEWEGKDGRPVDLGVSLGADVDDVTLVLKDASGRKVASYSLGAQSAGITLLGWEGKDETGRTLPAGRYRIEVTASGGSGAAVSATTVVAADVAGVSFQNGATYITLGGVRVPLSSVAEINE